MQSSWIGWVAFLVLGALITVSSCQAYFGTGNGLAPQQEGSE